MHAVADLFRRACYVSLVVTAAVANAATLYVSQLGDNSDGGSWERGFRTVQAALDAVPDGAGGHTIIIRPDTYMEANLLPAFRGAEGAYNTLTVDYDGSLGSGAKGYAVLDASDPQRGLKSVDWWSNFRASPEVSSIIWDRWILRHIYATGGDAGLFWDFPPKIEPFTVIVEDSVGIGRAFGGGAGHFLPRPDEPIVFRRCHLWALDWWGDAAGAYVRAENSEMQPTPDIIFEDCTIVGPDNALKSGNPGFDTYSRVKVKNSRLAVLNFSQPRGTPSTGIIHGTMDGKFFHVDLEDTSMMGYKVFGWGKAAESQEGLEPISYTTAGNVAAYVQFEQDVPEGIHRLGHFPADIFAQLSPPAPLHAGVQAESSLVKPDLCELSPVIWDGRLCHMECIRPASGGTRDQYYLRLVNAETGAELARFADGYGLACAFVHEGVFYAFASRFENDTWNDVTMFRSADLVNWDQQVVIKQMDDEHLFNSSVCAGPGGFVMAYESNDRDYPAFTVKFATSNDLQSWTEQPDVFGHDRYTACPTIRWFDGNYYVLYLERRAPRWFFETYIAQSPDLMTWTLAPKNPVLTPSGTDEGINASDPDIVEVDGKTLLYYAVGDQRTWMNVKRKVVERKEAEFLSSFFSPE
jgi:hypothetical protein